MRRKSTVLPLIVLLAAGCSTRQADLGSLPVQTVAGHLTMRTDGNWFKPCTTSSAAQWWVTFTEGSVAQFNNARDAGAITAGQPVFVRFRAALTDERTVGPGGPALLVRRIDELRAPSARDCSGTDLSTSDPAAARIITADITNFWQAYDALRPTSTRADTVAAFTTHYFQPATPGLASFIEKRIKSVDNLLMGLQRLPRYYASVRPATLRIREHQPAIRAAYRQWQALYPAATFPDLYFLISGFNTQGMVSDAGLLIGAEMVSADASTVTDELPPFLREVDLTPNGLPCIIVHELVHHEQQYGPGNTLLRQALVEGVADFLTMKAVGCRPTAEAIYDFGASHEAELWTQFSQAMRGTDFSQWFYNGGDAQRPGNLGYWMGYQIAASYYEQAADKQQAVHDMLHIQNFEAFLQASGYPRR